MHCELNNLSQIIKKIDREEKILIHCAGGYRSMIAASILKKNNFKTIYNIKNGIDNIIKNYQNSPFIEQ